MKNVCSNRKFLIFSCIVIFLTVISQTTYFVDLGLSSSVSVLLWGVFGFFTIIKSGKISLNRNIVIPMGIFAFVFIWILFASIVNYKYVESNLFFPMIISFIVMIIGSMCGDLIKTDDLKYLFFAYFIGSLVLALNVFFNNLLGSDIDSVIYSYSSKNSSGQIVFSGIILAIYLISVNKSKWGKLLYLIAIIYLLYVLLMMKSRSIIIMIPIVAIIMLFASGIKSSVKWPLFIIISIIALLLIFNKKFYEFVFVNVLLNNRSEQSLDNISSGRLSQWESFLPLLNESLFFGTGGTYKESVIMASYLSYGIVLGSLVMYLALYPIFFAVRLPKKKLVVTIYLLIAVTYVANGIFEELAPFGPGVKCFLLWFLTGYLSRGTENV